MMLAARNDHKLIDEIYEEFGLGYLYTLKNTGKKDVNKVQLKNCDESEIKVASDILLFI